MRYSPADQRQAFAKWFENGTLPVHLREELMRVLALIAQHRQKPGQTPKRILPDSMSLGHMDEGRVRDVAEDLLQSYYGDCRDLYSKD
jgi:hypothetical protein